MKEYDPHKMQAGVIRKSKKEQGFFDGRFVSRVEKSKKLYTRKKKHSHDTNND
jgi:hypothetical protein